MPTCAPRGRSPCTTLCITSTMAAADCEAEGIPAIVATSYI